MVLFNADASWTERGWRRIAMWNHGKSYEQGYIAKEKDHDIVQQIIKKMGVEARSNGVKLPRASAARGRLVAHSSTHPAQQPLSTLLAMMRYWSLQ